MFGHSLVTGSCLKLSKKLFKLNGETPPAASPPVFSFSIILFTSSITPVVDDSQNISNKLFTGSVS